MPDRQPSADLTLAEPRRPAAAASYGSEVIEGEFRELPARRLRDHLRVLYKHRLLAVACFAGCVAAAALITWMTPRTYSAAAQIQVARSSPIKLQLKDNVLDLDETERILNGASSFLATHVEALRSRDVAERAIRNFHLAANPAFVEPTRRGAPLTGTSALPSFLRPRGLPEDAADGAPAPAAGAVTPWLINQYASYLSVKDVRATDLIEVRFTAPNPEIAAFLTAAHIQTYIGFIQESHLTTDSTARAFLAQQLEESRAQAERAEAALAAFAADHPEVAVNQEDDSLARQIRQMSVRISDAHAQRALAQGQVEFLGKAARDPLPQILDGNPAIQKLRLLLLDIQAEEASLKDRLGPKHSQMRELRRRATDLRLQIDREVRQEVAAARSRLRAATLQEDELRRGLAELEKKTTALRALGAQYEFLKGERATARSLHESLHKQKTDTAVRSELATAKVRVVERPEVPRSPSWPNKRMNLLTGALAGLVLAIGAAFFRESMDTSVKSTEEAEGLLQLPTLATVPNFALAGPLGRGRFLPTFRPNGHGRAVGKQGGDADPLVVAHDPWSPIAETFRILRTALLYPSGGSAPQVIQLTSAASGEGKTVTALNLASALAEGGRRVLLVDVDLRHPGCHEPLGVPLHPGLSSFLDGRVELGRIVREIAEPRLWFIPAGPRPANPAELIGSERLHAALAELRAHFDFIVLDSPPVLPVTDAVLLSRASDCVLLVLKGQGAAGDVVRRARDQLLLAGARVVGLVVNNVTRSWGDYPLYHSYPHYFGTRPADAVAAREA